MLLLLLASANDNTAEHKINNGSAVLNSSYHPVTYVHQTNLVNFKNVILCILGIVQLLFTKEDSC